MVCARHAGEKELIQRARALDQYEQREHAKSTGEHTHTEREREGMIGGEEVDEIGFGLGCKVAALVCGCGITLFRRQSIVKSDA